MSASEKENNYFSSMENGEQKRKITKEKPYQAKLVWEGTKSDTECEKFKRYVESKYETYFTSDKDFHRWSVEKFETFWEAVWRYFNIIASKHYKEVFVKTGPGILDNEWFTEAKLNFAENLMRIRDETLALKYEDEEGNTDAVSYAKLFEEVQFYAAAFRKHGLEKGDRVACHMSNRKEAIFAMLATLSIGAIWGSAVPYLGAQGATNIISRMEPKILIVVDRHQEDGIEYSILSYLTTIVENTPTLQKVIIIPTKIETISKTISHIKNSCFLQDFLESGKLKNGTVPKLIFEQLPASHPVFLISTSGTTGISKITVHSTRVLLHGLNCVIFSYDIKQGDVFFNYFPMGWAPILHFVHCLIVGATLFLYSGNIFFIRKSRTIWDIISECRASFVPFSPSSVDQMEKINLVPDPALNLDSLRVIILLGSPVMIQNVEFLYKYISKSIFIGSLYGSTELFAAVSGIYLKSPCYAGEVQLPGLGMDICCYNKEGKSVVGELGKLVLTNPVINLPSYLWKDTDHSVMHSNYLSQFPGAWCQNDICWINPLTQGLVIKGRSDDSFIQNGALFGPADIYHAICHIEEIDDYICAAQNRNDGAQRCVLFVKMKQGYDFTPQFKKKIEFKIESELYQDCVPKVILPVKDIPYNMTQKRMESIVRKILANNEVPNLDNIRNPKCLKYYCNIPEIVDYYKN